MRRGMSEQTGMKHGGEGGGQTVPPPPPPSPMHILLHFLSYFNAPTLAFSVLSARHHLLH